MSLLPFINWSWNSNLFLMSAGRGLCFSALRDPTERAGFDNCQTY